MLPARPNQQERVPVSPEIGSVELGIQIDLAKRKGRFRLEIVRMGLQEGLQIAIGGSIASCEVIGEELEFLTQPPLHDSVIPVESHEDGSTIRHFFRT